MTLAERSQAGEALQDSERSQISRLKRYGRTKPSESSYVELTERTHRCWRIKKTF